MNILKKKNTNIQTYKYTNIQTYKHTNKTRLNVYLCQNYLEARASALQQVVDLTALFDGDLERMQVCDARSSFSPLMFLPNPSYLQSQIVVLIWSLNHFDM